MVDSVQNCDSYINVHSHKPTNLKIDSACDLLQAGFFLGLTFRLKMGATCPFERLVDFQRLQRSISQKTQIFVNNTLF
jgi:hypothetical protein